MSLCLKNDHQKLLDKKIQKQLNTSWKEYKSIIKLLLLGAGGSGKSTIFKQMKIIHANGFSKDELIRYKNIVYENTLHNCRALIQGVHQLKLKFDNKDNEKTAQRLMEIGVDQIYLKPAEVFLPNAENLKVLWNDKGIQAALEHKSVLQLNDSTEYYFQNLDRLASKDYVPTEQDVLRSRVRTVGIVEAEFDVKPLRFKMVDVGGQRNERRKWIHVFDSVTAIIFVTSLSEYDMVLEEDETMNRMRESMLLFDEICNCRYFKETSIIIFFNKRDLFAEKIKKTDLKVCFPDYTGGLNYESAFEFIKNKFLSLNKHTKKRQLYTHATCATDTDNIKTVFGFVKNIFLHDNIRDLNLD